MQPILRPAELEAFKAMQLRGWSTKVRCTGCMPHDTRLNQYSSLKHAICSWVHPQHGEVSLHVVGMS